MSKRNGTILEEGSASVFIKLRRGVITVKHGTDRIVLAKWKANQGDWDRLWTTIRLLQSQGGKP